MDKPTPQEAKPKAHSLKTWAVTGTYHGSIIEAKTEGDARRVFHKYYNGESITSVLKKDFPVICY